MQRLALLVTAASAALAAGLAFRAAAQSPTAADTETRQQVLVLLGHNTLAGRIDLVGEEYRVRSGKGEVLLPAAHVLRVCESLHDALAYLRSRTNLRDPQERMRLARWCLENGLREEARAEAEAAFQLAPHFTAAQLFLKGLEQDSAARTADAGKPVRPADRSTLAAVPAPKLSAEMMGIFTRRVQPLLFNGCGTAACHGKPGREGFALAVPLPSGLPNQEMTQRNLAATFAIIDAEAPSDSPLLVRALTAHGGAKQPPLPGPDSPAYRTLAAWVHSVAPGQPQTLAPVVASEPARPAPVPTRTGSGDERFGSHVSPTPNTPPPADQLLSPSLVAPPSLPHRLPPVGLPHVERRPKEAAKPQSDDDPRPAFPRNEGHVVGSSDPHRVPVAAATKPPAPSKPPARVFAQPVDEFDPAIFNQKIHPGKR